MGTSQSSHCDPNTSSVPDTTVPDPTCTIWYWLGQLGGVGGGGLGRAAALPGRPPATALPLGDAADACMLPSPIPTHISATARTPPINHQALYLRRDAVM